MKIGNRRIDSTSKVYILAEIGINHEGDPKLAKEMIDAAVSCGVDGVKFQSFKAGDLVDKKKSPEFYDLFKRVELTKADHFSLYKYCQSKKIDFISTPFDSSMVDLLVGLGVKAIKVASGDLTHHPMLRYIGAKKVPVILSTGMSYLAEVDEARRILYDAGCPGMVMLHCVSRYPTLPDELNLKAMVKLNQTFPEPVGFSDHSIGPIAAITAVAMGAKFIEKHFTLDRNLPGPDHLLSADPAEMKELVSGIRFVEQSMGRDEKAPTPEELENRQLGRRGCYASKDILKGQKLSLTKVKFTRPEGEIPASMWHRIEGKKASRNIKKGESLSFGDIGDI